MHYLGRVAQFLAVPGAGFWVRPLIVALGLLLVSVASMIVASIRRRMLWRTWGGLLACGLVAVVWVYVTRAGRPLFDDGPFRGRARADCPSSTPDQLFPVASGGRLEVFDPTDSQHAPTVLLRTRSGQVKWCIYAEGLPSTRVRSIRFRQLGHGPLGGTVVLGTVDWTYGQEGSAWFIGPFGGLSDYWYSW